MLRQTLCALLRQTLSPLEILVVDTTPSDIIPALIATEFPKVRILHRPDGPRCMPWSRNEGIKATNGEVVAFLDDDAIAEPQWLAEIVDAYGDDVAIGGVGGRIIEGVDLGGNKRETGKEVAASNRFGFPVADFDSITPYPVEVDHFRGCNMSFRRSALMAISGFDEGYDATAKREESDVCLRIRRAGFRLLYNSRATVDHKTFSLVARKRVLVENVISGWPDARLDGYYVAKNLGVVAWVTWYLHSNVYAFARAIKITYMVFTRATLGLGGGTAGLIQALRRERHSLADD